MKRREFLVLVAITTVLVCNRSVSAQEKVRRVGYLSAGSPITDNSPTSGPVIDGLKRRGWIEGSTIHFERRAAEGQIDRLPDLVNELVAVGVEAILTSGFPAVLPARTRQFQPSRRAPVIWYRSGWSRAFAVQVETLPGFRTLRAN